MVNSYEILELSFIKLRVYLLQCDANKAELYGHRCRNVEELHNNKTVKWTKQVTIHRRVPEHGETGGTIVSPIVSCADQYAY